MKILYGTTNPAKIKNMRTLLAGFDIELIGINELNMELPIIIEDGLSPMENARKKAEAYFKATGIPVFSCDTGLYIEGLSVAEQPGMLVRRKHITNALCDDMQINKSDMTDEEMVDYYSNIAKKLGGKAYAWYENAICFILSETECYEKQGGDLSSDHFILSETPHQKREEGFPLDCLSVDIKSQKYYYDLPELQTELSSEAEGFKNFFQHALTPIRLGILTESMAKEVCKWRYEGLYSVYNLSEWEVVVSNCWELASEVARNEYFVSMLLENDLIGFGRIQMFDDKVSLGIGLKPDICGKGYGQKAMQLLVKEAKRRYPNTEIGLDVRKFNERAKKCYENLGFVTERRYMKETIQGYIAYEYMRLLE